MYWLILKSVRVMLKYLQNFMQLIEYRMGTSDSECLGGSFNTISDHVLRTLQYKT